MKLFRCGDFIGEEKLLELAKFGHGEAMPFWEGGDVIRVVDYG
jgi:hypothetical protein